MTHTFDSKVSLNSWLLWPTVCQKVQKSVWASSNRRLFDGTGFASNTAKNWVGNCLPYPPASGVSVEITSCKVTSYFIDQY